MDVNTLDDTDLKHLRAAIALSRQAKAKGNGPYGALVVGADGRVLVEAENDQRSSGDCTGHAEMNAIRLAARLGPRALAGATIYASAEPCAMCAAAVFWSGAKRLVYALGSERNYALLPPSDDELRLGCRALLGHGKRAIEIVGPVLEDEAARVFTG
jgi:tRNA(Arg) A34 adenosine deaminase TadA